jgi:hypothetical protein
MTFNTMTLDAECQIFIDKLEVSLLSVVMTPSKVLFTITTLGNFYSYLDYFEGCNDIQHNDTRC